MEYFEKLPLIFDENKLLAALCQVLDIAPWERQHQICLTKKEGEKSPDCFYEGNGGIYRTMVDGQEVIRQQELDERDYNVFIPEFEHTYFKEVYDTLSKKFKLGRVRILLKEPRSTLSWHRDPEPRLHIPIITNPGSIMVIENVAKHLPADGSVWITNNTKYHNAFNGGEESRIHLVACVLNYKFN